MNLGGHFPCATSAKDPRSMHARVPQAMAQFVLKIEKLSHIMGPTPILEMARAYGLRPRLWLLMKLKSFPAFGARLWNCLHPDWRKLTKRAFKRKIHKLLLTVLEIENYYVDAHSLILNLSTRIELS